MAFTAPLDEIDICNQALLSLREKKLITTLNPPVTFAEKVCATFYHQIRRATLRSHPFHTSTKRAILAASTTAPLFEFSHAFPLPTDFIRYLSRHDTLGQIRLAHDDDFALENGQILINAEDSASLRIRYTFDNTVVATWDPLFINLLVLNLAIKIAPNFSSNEARVRELKEELKEAKIEAKAVNGQEKPPKRIQRSRFIQARRTNPTVADSFTRFE